MGLRDEKCNTTCANVVKISHSSYTVENDQIKTLTKVEFESGEELPSRNADAGF